VKNVDERIEELTLLLLYLTSWDEKIGEYKIKRSWKGYDFDILNELDEKGLINGGRKSKSVYFTEDGAKKAEELIKMYFSNATS
jgi:hypothetical protein